MSLSAPARTLLTSGAGVGRPPLRVAVKRGVGERWELQPDRPPSPTDPLPLGRDLSHLRFHSPPSSDEGNKLLMARRPSTPPTQLGFEFWGS